MADAAAVGDGGGGEVMVALWHCSGGSDHGGGCGHGSVVVGGDHWSQIPRVLGSNSPEATSPRVQ